MPQRDTANFLRILNETNERIAANTKNEVLGVDEVRLQREKERRQKLGTLRAREHHGKRPIEVRNVFGYTDLS